MKHYSKLTWQSITRYLKGNNSYKHDVALCKAELSKSFKNLFTITHVYSVIYLTLYNLTNKSSWFSKNTEANALESFGKSVAWTYICCDYNYL